MSSRIALPSLSAVPSSRPAPVGRSAPAQAAVVPAVRAESAFVSAPKAEWVRLTGDAGRAVPLPSLDLGMDVQGLNEKADAIAKALGFGKLVRTGGGDGEVWRTYEHGRVDGDIFGSVRGAWVGGEPWTPKSTFLDAQVIQASMDDHMGPFFRSTKVDGQTVYTFFNGAVAEDAKGVVTPARDALQFAADAIAEELGLGAYARTGGGDGEVWREYAKGTVDGDMFGNVRGVWMGGSPWAENTTYVPKKVVEAVVREGLGAFQGATKQGELTEFAFAGGKVTQDAAGTVTVVRGPASA